jgi:putative isomerase
MTAFSRREVLASLAMTSLSTVASGREPAAVPDGTQQRLSPAERRQAADKLLQYLRGTAPQLLRPAEGILKHPSISPSLPGKEYSTNLWDWDTYWTTRGLFQLSAALNDRELHNKVALHARGSLENFLDHQSDGGRIPIMMDVKDPDPFGCLKKDAPKSQNQAKPVFGQLALLIADETKDARWFASHFDKLTRFHESWVARNQSATGLLVWGNDVAIGNDNDPTTFGRPDFSSANLLLNCLFYEDLRSAAEMARRLSRTQDKQRLANQAQQLKDNIEKHCWDPRDRFYYTVDVQCKDRRAELIPNLKPGMDMSWTSLPLRVQVFTGFLPLWCGVATPHHAKDLVAANYMSDDRFRANHGVRSLSSKEAMYSLAFSSNPSNWLGPAWIVVNYFVWKGLNRYGYHEAAAELADKTLRMLAADVEKNGSLNEYYHPDTGAPLSHKGFMDWNMLVLEMVS